MEYWQNFLPPRQAGEAEPGIWTDRTEARMPDGNRLVLPLRDLGEFAVAGLIANQASFAVFDRLTGWLAELARRFAPDVVVGLPTLGHAFGVGVARALGHANWVAPGTSRKFWYDEALSVHVARSPAVAASVRAAGAAGGRRGEHRRLAQGRAGDAGGGRGGADRHRCRHVAGRPLARRAARRADPVGGVRHAVAGTCAGGVARAPRDMRQRLLPLVGAADFVKKLRMRVFWTNRTHFPIAVTRQVRTNS